MVWNEPSFAQIAVKPGDYLSARCFPKTDYAFHPGTGEWYRGWPPPDEGGKLPHSRSLAQQYLIESARERTKELVVFGAVVLASAWPVIYMVVTVFKLLAKGHPLD